tara:strand:- start:14788 stop:16119 length:1332 start_codon:yes stop_codon:yes gene_type:complete
MKNKINLLYQTWIDDKPWPNCIPTWKRNKEYFNNWGNVKYEYLEEILDYSGIEYTRNTTEALATSDETFWFHIQPEWIDLSFFYENVFHFIDEDVLNQIKCNDQIKILIWFPTEGFNLDMPKFMENILWTIGDKGIPDDKVYLVFGDLRIEENFKTYLKKHKLESAIKTFGLNIFELNYRLETDRMYFSRDRMKEIKVADELVHPDYVDDSEVRTMKFVCRNANPRRHRIWIMSQLYKQNYLKDGYTSFLNRYFTPDVQSVDIRDAVQFTKQDPRQALEEMRKFIAESTPIILDNTADDIGEQLNQRRMNIEHYANSYFSIINETVCESAPGDPLFITEKVYQPILQLHPFIVVGSRGTLAHLQDYGYKTFEPMFDSKYDWIENSAERIDSAWKQINLMCGMKNEDLHRMYFEIYDKLLYNRELFLKLNKKTYLEGFMKWLTK